jgi:hypothetical protein
VYDANVALSECLEYAAKELDPDFARERNERCAERFEAHMLRAKQEYERSMETVEAVMLEGSRSGRPSGTDRTLLVLSGDWTHKGAAALDRGLEVLKAAGFETRVWAGRNWEVLVADSEAGAARMVLLADEGTREWVKRGLDVVLPKTKEKKSVGPSVAADPLTPLGLHSQGVAFVRASDDGRKVIELLKEAGVSALSQGSATDGYHIHADYPERASVVLRHAVGSGRLDAARVTLTWEERQRVLAALREAVRKGELTISSPPTEQERRKVADFLNAAHVEAAERRTVTK